ncbi:MAG TPA: DDE-type integrase/transposase/recombinase [Ktedonobacteraceae bacterium]|nr:DDE-type integrase/transposase/recombinase [Ktedonobacteraceae bacterium]
MVSFLFILNVFSLAIRTLSVNLDILLAVKVIDKFIKEVYEHHKQKTKREVYGEFENYCKDNGIPTPPSYKTFVALVLKRPRHEQIKKRAGSRAAHGYEPPVWELTWNLPLYGDHPWEVVHIDHTQLDVELVDSKTGKNLGRPWSSFMTDAYSRRLLAVYLTFDNPSYKSCMMVIRECVRRYGRVPQSIIVDWGKEFESIDFEALLARYDCTKVSRPTGKPRFAQVIERLFNTANTTFVHNLAGNTQATKKARQMTASVNPRKHAVWTLETLYARLREWAYEVYDTNEHAGIGQTPREAFTKGLLQSGVRGHTEIPYDDAFIYDTLPSTRKGTAMLKPQGVKIHYFFYYSRAFTDYPELLNTQIEVRYDPYDIGYAYARIDGGWKKCLSAYHARFEGRSEKELQLISEQLRKQKSRHGQQFAVTAAKLAAFVTSLEEEEELLLQRRRDAEAKAVIASIGRSSQDSSQAIAPSNSSASVGITELSSEMARMTPPQVKQILPPVEAICEDF